MHEMVRAARSLESVLGLRRRPVAAQFVRKDDAPPVGFCTAAAW